MFCCSFHATQSTIIYRLTGLHSNCAAPKPIRSEYILSAWVAYEYALMDKAYDSNDIVSHIYAVTNAISCSVRCSSVIL